jgi:two-component system NtrC family sensor kinase
VGIPTATARLWLAAAASGAVIGGAYLLESQGHTWAAAGLVAAGVAAGAVRFLMSSRADRRYAKVLENEVATQTRSLVDSLAATAAAERHLRLVMDAVPDAIAVLDRDGRVLDLNESAKRLLAAPLDQGAGRSVFASLEPDAAATVRERLAAAFRGEVQRFEVVGRREDGTKGLSTMLYAPVRERGEVTRVLALARDITDQKHTEHQLQQAEKLSAMGQLVSGVAHEINNPAAIISGFAQTLLLDVVKPEHREMLQMIYDEATRIGRITANLLAFARAGGSQRTLVDLNDIVRRTFALRSYHLTTLNIAVTLELSPAEPKFWADPSELQQLLLNLLINAEQALVSLETPRTIVVRTVASEEEGRLEVADSGPGIAPDIRAKIFDPFFTTKPEGVGTGLGLSICYGIAREHGGRIWVDSPPGGGATFVVALPRDPRREGRAFPEAPAPSPTPPATGTVTVLIVDDETALRNALLRFLDRRGIQGEGVADGADALRALGERDFDVIISDVRMPGISGREFMERLRRERPALVARLIFSTGDTFAPETAALIKEAGLPTVTKPFDFAELERVIRQVAAEAERRRPRASA